MELRFRKLNYQKECLPGSSTYYMLSSSKLIIKLLMIIDGKEDF